MAALLAPPPTCRSQSLRRRSCINLTRLAYSSGHVFGIKQQSPQLSTPHCSLTFPHSFYGPRKLSLQKTFRMPQLCLRPSQGDESPPARRSSGRRGGWKMPFTWQSGSQQVVPAVNLLLHLSAPAQVSSFIESYRKSEAAALYYAED